MSQESHNKNQLSSRIWRKYIFDALIILVILSAVSGIGYAFMGLPNTDDLNNLHLVSATQVFDSNGQLISKLFEENRVVVTLTNISPYVQNAIIANEDSRFYNHFGIDVIGIVRAVFVNLRQGGIVEGGSTLTQQLAKNLFLTQEQTFSRKIKEALLAIIIERKFSKQEILQAYLNQVYFGEGAYGVEAASQLYFAKRASELTLAESAMLAGLPRGPNIYSPYIDPAAAMQRRSVVLSGMAKEGYITEQQASSASSEPLQLAGKKRRTVQASYFLDYVASELVGRYGANRVYKGGLKVYTTLDLMVQQVAEGALGQFQGAVLSLDPRSGYIRAMVGGKNYQESQINRVISEVRQPGSAFKPILYAAALNSGLTAASVIIDEPFLIGKYRPQNYDKKFRGPVTLKKALRNSINIPAVKLGQQIGMENVLNLGRALGITTLTPEDNNLAAALGGLTHGVSLMELSTAYTAFANNGIVSKPIAILKVEDENGQILEEARLNQQTALRADVAYIVTDILKSVLESGTATPANLGRPAAGKTGTTDEYETAWFIGYTPDLLTGIYVGNDNRVPVGISGTEVSAMWGTMMIKIVSGIKATDFVPPPNVVTKVPICADSGKLAPPAGCSEVEYSAFIRGTEPTILDQRLLGLPGIDGQTAPGQQGKQPTDPSPRQDRSPWKFPWRLPGF